MTSRKLRKSPGAGFGQYPDSVFKEQVGFSQRLAAICVYRETFQGMEDLHPQMVKQARSSGQLNLSNRGLVRDSKSGERGEHALAIFLPLLC